MSKDTPTILPKDHQESRKAAKKAALKLLESRARQLKEQEGPQLPTDDNFEARHPFLWELLTPQRLQGTGKKWDRRPATLSISIDQGLWRATVRDNDLQTACSCVTLTFDELLAALELACADPRNWTQFRQRGRGLREIAVK